MGGSSTEIHRHQSVCNNVCTILLHYFLLTVLFFYSFRFLVPKSSYTSLIHLFLGLCLFVFPICFLYITRFAILFPSNLYTYPTHLTQCFHNWYDVWAFMKFCQLMICFSPSCFLNLFSSVNGSPNISLSNLFNLSSTRFSELYRFFALSFRTHIWTSSMLSGFYICCYLLLSWFVFHVLHIHFFNCIYLLVSINFGFSLAHILFHHWLPVPCYLRFLSHHHIFRLIFKPN